MARKENSIINQIASALAHNPGLTGAELSERINIPSAYRRLSEVRRLGLAKTGRARKCTVTGHRSLEWFADNKPPEPDRGELSPYQEIKRLKARIQFLEEQLNQNETHR